MQTILMCQTRQGPTPEQVADALRQSGYSAFVEAQGGDPEISLRAEIRYAPGRMPIVIDFCHDEGDIDYWEWMEELLPGEKDREGIHCFIFVDAMENVDKKALQVVVDYLRIQTDATVISQEQTSKL